MRRRKWMVLVVLGGVLLAGCNGPEGGQMSVVRNGSVMLPDNTKIREGKSGYMCPGQESRWNGWGSDLHSYPDSSSQRTFKFNDDEDADAPPIENLRTQDGVKVTLNGTVFFKTAFNCTPEGIAKVQAFDQANVNRPEGQRPWEDFPGWLANQWKPILDSTARDVLLGIQCKEVVSSCALLAREENVELPKNADNKSSVQRIESALRDGLVTKLKEKLGQDFFAEITFNMEQPLLPEVDNAIATAQRAYAKVADVRAERLKAQEQVRVEVQKRKANFQRQKGYGSCPSCARQDELSKLPRGLQTLVFGSGAPIAIGK
jgi:hypothetical protein